MFFWIFLFRYFFIVLPFINTSFSLLLSRQGRGRTERIKKDKIELKKMSSRSFLQEYVHSSDFTYRNTLLRFILHIFELFSFSNFSPFHFFGYLPFCTFPPLPSTLYVKVSLRCVQLTISACYNRRSRISRTEGLDAVLGPSWASPIGNYLKIYL